MMREKVTVYKVKNLIIPSKITMYKVSKMTHKLCSPNSCFNRAVITDEDKMNHWHHLWNK